VELPARWTSDAADIAREERKREHSPSSYFFSQGRALVLAAQYFVDDRLVPGAHGGVAKKHRHRINLALFGQLMAAHEFLLKDFIASVVDTVPTFDEALMQAKWIQVDTSRVLSFRSASSTPGDILLHSTQGWFDPDTVNKRYKALFRYEPIASGEIPMLETLWILRHSVAHNAGFVGAHDAMRGSMPHLAGHVADIGPEFIEDAFLFLCEIARRIATVIGDRVLLDWLKTRVPAGKAYTRDNATYVALKHLATFVESRPSELPEFTEGDYLADFSRAQNG